MGDIDHSTKAKFTSLTQKLVELSKKHSNILGGILAPSRGQVVLGAKPAAQVQEPLNPRARF